MSLDKNALALGLTKIWSEAAYNFPYLAELDIDWEKEYADALPRIMNCSNVRKYYMELARFVALLRDGHTYSLKMAYFRLDSICIKTGEKH